MGNLNHILKYKTNIKVLTLMFVLCFGKSWGQAILQWNTFGNAGTETTEPSVYNDPNLSATNLTQGSITAAGNANRFGGSAWSTGGTSASAVTGNDYIEFIVTPTGGCSVTPTSFDFSWDKSGTGPVNVSLRSSADGFAADLGVVAPVAAMGTFNTITITGLTNISVPITFRIYGYGASAGTGTGGFDIATNIVNVQLNGSTSCVPPCSAPTGTISTTSQTLCTSAAASFSVGSSATIPTYVWQMSSNNSTWVSIANGSPTGASYSASTLATLSYTTGSASSTYYYRCLVTENGTCTATSNVNTITVNTPVAITSGATNKGLCSGGNTTMDITGAVATKLWYVSTDNGVTFNPVTLTTVYTSGITTNALSITNPPVSFNNNQYYCTVSVAGCPTLTSSIGVLTVTQTPAAPPTPTALANPACSGTALIAMTSTVVGVTWYWQGTTSMGTSTTNPTSLNDNISTSGTYYVRARTDGSSCLSAQSSTVITINTPPNVLTNPIDKSVCVGNNTTFSVSASGSGLSYIWQVNTGSGFTNLTNVAPYSNVTTAIMTITGITAGMNGYLYQCVVNGASPCTAATSTIATLVITAAGTPVTPASLPVNSAIACNAFNLSWTNGSGSNRLVVVSAAPVLGAPVNGTSYTANSTFGSGGTIAAGEFVVYKGIGSSVFITGLVASTTYYYKIFEFNGCSVNYLTSGIIPNGNVTTINCSSTPGLTGVYINACGGGCGYEGNNEMIWGVTGSYGLNVNNNGPILDYIGTTQVATYGLNAAAINALNVATGSCTNTVFVDPNTLGYIPANAKFLIANSCMCMPSAYDLSGLCNSGPVYVVFGTGPNWACNTSGGIFGNTNSGGVKDFDIDFTPWGVSIIPSYSFTAGSLSPSDGAAISLNPNGGAATGYFNNGCAVPYTILPIDLIDFYATQNGSKNDLIWKVASEKNISQYIIEKSEDGLDFNEMTRLNSIAEEGEARTYMIEDENPYSDITYYRLSTLENNGKINRHKIIDINRTNKNWESLLYQNDNDLILEFKNAVPKNSTIELFDLSGKLLADETIKDSQTKINTQYFSEGIYFLRITTPYKTQNFKIVIQK